MLKRYLALAAILPLVAACGDSVESLVKNEAKREKILKECAEKGPAAKDEQKCKNAVEAQAEAMKRAAQGILGS